MKSTLQFTLVLVTTILIMILYIELTASQDQDRDLFQCPPFVLIGKGHNEYCCSDSQCLSTICHEHECICKSVGGACEKNVECCSSSCNSTSMKCQCSFKLNGTCTTNIDCCYGTCTSDNTCGPKADGALCTLNSDCESKICNSNKLCGCKEVMQSCLNDDECCPVKGRACQENKCCVIPSPKGQSKVPSFLDLPSSPSGMCIMEN